MFSSVATDFGSWTIYIFMPLCNFLVCKFCPLYNFKSVQDIFMKFGININHYQTVCREREL